MAQKLALVIVIFLVVGQFVGQTSADNEGPAEDLAYKEHPLAKRMLKAAGTAVVKAAKQTIGGTLGGAVAGGGVGAVSGAIHEGPNGSVENIFKQAVKGAILGGAAGGVGAGFKGATAIKEAGKIGVKAGFGATFVGEAQKFGDTYIDGKDKKP
ncbi:hypothetical protein AALO_G00266180 [Alosa alosa]|uniref:Uncharacterized protein n=1 Tax=Alosa alosa TaxID=278164 RepID=A0AAV6FL34_9TELE|nr:hypothetical protein AALO_G00266180 [Alosa alosa]